MRVSNIEVNGQRFDGTCHRATISMVLHTDEQTSVTTQFLCKSTQDADCPADQVHCDLLQDALRQARRMPGFRTGEIELDISSAQITAA